MDVGTLKEVLLPGELFLCLKERTAALHDVIDARHGFLHHCGVGFAACMDFTQAANVAVEVVFVLPFDQDKDQKDS